MITKLKKDAVTENKLPKRVVNFMRADFDLSKLKLVFTDASVLNTQASNSVVPTEKVLAIAKSVVKEYKQDFKNLSKR